MGKEVVYKPPYPTSEKINTPIEQQKEFFLTWSEWAVKKRTQINRAYTAGGGYTVPAGFTLFITSIWISSTVYNNVNATCAFTPSGTNQPILALAMLSANNSVETQSIALNLSSPYRLEQNQTIIFSTGFQLNYAGFTGWLEPNPSS